MFVDILRQKMYLDCKGMTLNILYDYLYIAVAKISAILAFSSFGV